jgi:hypothetical protein
MTIIGGVNMLKVRSYALSVTGSIIALFPFALGFFVGLPFGIWSLVVLFRPDIRAAFARARGADKNKPMSTKGKILVFYAIAFVILATMMAIGLPMLWSIAAAKRVASQPQPVETYTPYGVESLETIPTKIGDLDLPRGVPGHVEFGPEGPTLTNECVKILGLESSEGVVLNSILQAAYGRYLELEGRHIVRVRGDDNLSVTISPFREEAEDFLERLWADLDEILDGRRRAIARRHLPLGQIFGTFQFGGPTVKIAINKQGGSFNYDTKYEWPEGSGKSGSGTSGRSGALPPEYRRFWQDEPPSKMPRSTGE